MYKRDAFRDDGQIYFIVTWIEERPGCHKITLSIVMQIEIGERVKTMEALKQMEVAVIGGGLAGLTAAVYLAKAGRSVILLEKTDQFGGRAQTTNKNDVLFNLGPHALFSAGTAIKILTELGCKAA